MAVYLNQVELSVQHLRSHAVSAATESLEFLEQFLDKLWNVDVVCVWGFTMTIFMLFLWWFPINFIEIATFEYTMYRPIWKKKKKEKKRQTNGPSNNFWTVKTVRIMIKYYKPFEHISAKRFDPIIKMNPPVPHHVPECVPHGPILQPPSVPHSVSYILGPWA